MIRIKTRAGLQLAMQYNEKQEREAGKASLCVASPPKNDTSRNNKTKKISVETKFEEPDGVRKMLRNRSEDQK